MGVAAAAPTLAPPTRRLAAAPPQPAHKLGARNCNCGVPAKLSGQCESCDRASLGRGGPATAAQAPPALREGLPRDRLPLGQAAAVPVASPVAAPAPVIRLALQKRLRVSDPGDPAEQEAHEVGATVARMADPSAPIPSPRVSLPPVVQRRATTSATAPDDVMDNLRQAGSGGTALPREVRNYMEPRFGADFGPVQVHTDDRAAALSSRLGASAFTVGPDIYFARGAYQPASPHGRELIAHELTHTIQQSAVRQNPPATRPIAAAPRVAARAPASIQRLGISDALNFFANQANNIPGFRLLTIVLGVNPINMSTVDRSAANILRAIVEFIPGGGLIVQALNSSGVFEKAGAWISDQLNSLGLVGASIRKAIDTFLASLSWTDIFDLGGVWERAKRIFTEPIDRLIAFAKGLLDGILKLIKEAILKPLAQLASQTQGWDLLCAVLGKNPITGEVVPRTAETLIPGFLKLIGHEDAWQNMQNAHAIPRAWAWFQGTMAALIAFVSQIPDLFLAALKSLTIEDVVLVVGAFQKVASVFGGFLVRFIEWAGKALWDLAEIIIESVSPGALAYIKKTGAALKSIILNPLPFVGNLVKAAKLGFQNFADHFGTHLKAGLIDWLTGSLPGVYIPKAFELAEIVKFVLSVLGISWANVRLKLVKVVGEPAVKAMETGFDIVVILVRDGPAAAWDKIKEQLGNLKDMVISGITDFVVDMVVQKAIPKLIAMFIPGAGFVSAILSIYDTVMVFVNKLAQIAAAVKAFIDSIVAIASGEIGAAAAKVESVLAGLLSLAINFLAGFIGLGKVADKIMGVITKVRATIDKALDALINWIVTTAKRLFAKIFGKDGKPDERTDAQKQKALDDAINEAEHMLEDDTIPADDVRKHLGAIQAKYKLTSLTLNVAAGGPEGQETDQLEGTINPTKKGPPVRKLKPHPSKDYVTVVGGRYMLKPAYQNKTFTRDMCYGKSFRQGVIDWRDGLLSKPRNVGGLRHPTDFSRYYYDGSYYVNDGNTRASLDHKHMVVEHWNDTGRKTTQDARKDWFNAIGNLSIVPLSVNSSMGAEAGINYDYRVTLVFRYP
jgi:hypothetical protein